MMNQVHFKERMNYWQTTGLIIAVIAYMFCATFLEIPKENQRTVDTCIAFLMGTVLGTIVNFIYGSSKNAKPKPEEKVNQES